MDRAPPNDRFNIFPTTDPRCRMTPLTRPEPQKASTVLCCIFVIVVTGSLVVLVHSLAFLQSSILSPIHYILVLLKSLVFKR